MCDIFGTVFSVYIAETNTVKSVYVYVINYTDKENAKSAVRAMNDLTVGIYIIIALALYESLYTDKI